MGFSDFFKAAKKVANYVTEEGEKRADNLVRSMPTEKLKMNKEKMESEGIPNQFGYEKIVNELRRRHEL